MVVGLYGVCRRRWCLENFVAFPLPELVVMCACDEFRLLLRLRLLVRRSGGRSVGPVVVVLVIIVHGDGDGGYDDKWRVGYFPLMVAHDAVLSRRLVASSLTRLLTISRLAPWSRRARRAR